MDVQGFINASTSPQYEQWKNAHPNASYTEDESVVTLIQSSSFQSWLSSNPSGTVDQYLSQCQRQRDFLNSPQGQIQELMENIDALREDNIELTSEIDKLKTEIIDKDDTISSLHTSLSIFSTLSFVFFIAAVFLLIKLHKH